MTAFAILKKAIKRAAAQFGVDIRRVTHVSNANLFDVIRRLSAQRPITTILDVGANVGQTAALLCLEFPSATIHSIEPFPDAFELLKQNTRQYPNVVTRQRAIGDSDSVSPFFVNRSSTTNSLLRNSPRIDEYIDPGSYDPVGTVEIQVQTVESFCREQKISVVDLLKIDAQGYELKILQGASRMLQPSQIRFIYLEVLFVPLYDGQAYFDEVAAMLRGCRYKLFGLYGIRSDPTHGLKWADALFV